MRVRNTDPITDEELDEIRAEAEQHTQAYRDDVILRMVDELVRLREELREAEACDTTRRRNMDL